MPSSTATSPEILIVVSKLLTGFDAPRNTVLYLTRKLKEHTLLQAIARVNRLYETMRDPAQGVRLHHRLRGVLGELDQALTTYSALEGFDEEDLAGALASINDECGNCRSATPSCGTSSRPCQEPPGRGGLRATAGRREARARISTSGLSAYAKTLAIALSTEAVHHRHAEQKAAGATRTT